jgi:hypothetical protein
LQIKVFHINVYAYDSNDNCLPALALLLNFACFMGVLGGDSLSGECFLFICCPLDVALTRPLVFGDFGDFCSNFVSKISAKVYTLKK